jgi:nucleoside-diphosphate-sugar epimerase
MLPIFQWMRRGIALVPGSPDARTSLIHVDDLVTAIEACLGSAGAPGQTLSLCDGREGGYSWREMAEIAGELFSRDVRLFKVPRWLLNAIARCNSATAGITRRAPMLTPPKLRELRHENWVVDNRAITAATGWNASMELPAGLKSLNLAAN